ncbi:MAG: hypothetical protein HY751_05435 [Nitrospinae bacterium]|nr:hypothetical protein [Nitrospinota bacterium]
MKYKAAASLAAYLLSASWYGWDAYNAYIQAFDVASKPFIMDVSTAPSVAFTFTGLLYWVTFGLDRSGTPAAIAGYFLAGAQVLAFAFQVWLAPTLWALNNLTQ